MMQKFGHDVQVVTYDPSPDEKLNYRQDLSINKYVHQGIRVTSVKSHLEDPYTSFDLENKPVNTFFSNLFRMEKPDLFHIAHPMRMTSAFWEAKKQKIKTVITLTDYWMLCGKGIMLRNNDAPCTSPQNGENCKKYCYQHLQDERLRQRVEEARKIFKASDGMIASANFLVDLFKFNHYDISKISLIRHGYNYFDHYIPISNTKKENKNFTFISAGSLIPSKGAHILISAFKKLKSKNLRLKIYGSSYGNDGYIEFLKKLTKDDKRISFEGTYSVDETPKIHQEADVVVQPSLWYETYPLVGVASLAYGVPIIVPDMTGAAELVNPGENGYIFKFGDIDSLSQQLAKAYEDKLKYNNTIFYSQSIESEAVSTESLYYKLISS